MPHNVMKKASVDYVAKVAVQQAFIKAAEESFEHYKETVLHITFNEFSAWVNKIQKNPETAMPSCHM